MAEEKGKTVEDVQQHEENSADQVVTPWEAHAAEGQSGIDYEKLISEL